MLQSLNQEIADIRDQVKRIQSLTGNQIVVYGCLTNNYDISIAEVLGSREIDYLLFIDNVTKVIPPEGWHVIRFDFIYRDYRRTNRLFKILPHKFLAVYDLSLYTDTNVVFKPALNDFLKDVLRSNSTFVTFNHNRRNCLYQEAKNCLFWNKDDTEIIKKQIVHYKNQGYLKNQGLELGGFLFRKHSDLWTKKVCEDWWEQVDRFSTRDQISLIYILNNAGKRDVRLPNTKRAKYFDINDHEKAIHYDSNTPFWKKLIHTAIILIVKVKRNLH